MRHLLREPLLHFTVIGSLLFVLYGVVSKESPARTEEIVVDRAQLDALIQEHRRVWHRAPTPEELSRAIETWVREEVLYREGLAAALDRGDSVVRRRVVQKMTFVAESMAAEPPSDAELQAWFRARAADYRLEPTYSLRQAFFDSTRHGADLDVVITRARSVLQADAEAQVGDRTLLPLELSQAPIGEVERHFGKQFAGALATLADGTWAQVESEFGMHLVRIDARQSARTPGLEEVKSAVERDFASARTEQAVEAFYRDARARYRVRTEARPNTTPTSMASAKGTSQDDT